MSLIRIRSTILAAALMVASLCAQHLSATLNLNNGDSGKFTLNNFDTANSGTGSVDEWNGVGANIVLSWERMWINGEWVVVVSAGGVHTADLYNAGQGSQNGGAQVLGPIGGTWNR